MSRNLYPHQSDNMEFIPDSPQAESLYFHVFSAMQLGKLDLDSLNPHNPQTANMMVQNGLIPDQAGSMVLPGDKLGVYDLVDGVLAGDELRVFPTDKSAVDKTSRQIQKYSGLVVLSNIESGTIKLVAEIFDPSKSDWNQSLRNVGNCALRPLGIDAPTYEVDELSDNGVIVAKSVKKTFRVSRSI